MDTVFLSAPSNREVGEYCHKLAKRLFPICRSITGPGVRETLAILGQELPGLTIHSVNSGTQAFDWTVPDEWSIRDAYIADEAGNRIVDFKQNNLHVVGYSEPVNAVLPLDDLQKHLYSLPEQPDAIPYVTSYYSRRWGFCLTDNQRRQLKPGNYKVYIDSTIEPGELNYGELILPGKTSKEIFISTYICHPSLANNELSGPVVTAAIARWLKGAAGRHYTYRIVFIPETIGSVVYLSRNLDILKQNVIAGFNVTCIGDDRCYSFLPSRNGQTLADIASRHVLKHIAPDYKRYTWLDRGSDERQYCSPGVDLPVATIMRSKYGEYPEYHTSLDDLDLVTPSGLQGGFNALSAAIEAIENDITPVSTVPCEPQLGKRGLYPTVSSKGSAETVRTLMNMLSYCDGKHSLLEIAEVINAPISMLVDKLQPIIANGLVHVERRHPL